MNLWTRRQFMQISTAAALQLAIGCAPKEMNKDGNPMHHLTSGYRNFPITPEPEIGGITLTALPAVHFSGRGINDRNETLWCSWAIQTPSRSIFFAGDTGYSPVIFKGIGQTFKSFDIAIVPIGAYDPARVMQPVHTNPEEAIQMANDVNADLIIPSHWGTITLTDETPWEPIERYRAFALKNGISDGRACIMKIGETRVI